MQTKQANFSFNIANANSGILRTFYVANNGNDSNNGSAAAPWLTLKRATGSIKPGDMIIVRQGTYTGFMMGWDFPQPGTATNPIVIMADPAAPTGSVIINARVANMHSGIDLEPGCDYITIQGFKIDGSAGTIMTYPDKGYGIKVTGSFCKVLNNTIVNLDYGTAGIHSNGGNNNLIEGNTISFVHNHNVVNLGHGIYIANGDGVIVRNNTIFNNDYIGIHVNGDPNLVSHAIIEKNLIYNNGQNGINCDGLQSSIVRNNLIYGYKNYGIALYKIDSSGPSSNNIIANNTIVSTVAGTSASIRILNAGSGNIIVNNILLDVATYRISNDSLPGLISDYNIVANKYISEDNGTSKTLAQWQASNQDLHSFVDIGANIFISTLNYHLKIGSTAINKGTANNAPLVDLENKVRPQGSAFDIGCYEF